MRRGDFEFVADLLKRRSGLVLAPDKAYLLDNRLTPVARRRSMAGLVGLIEALRNGHDNELAREVVEAMTNNETYFFRDPAAFEALRATVLPRLLSERAQTRSLRIWSAACATGQEPYSIAMVLAELGPKLAGWTVDILATDLSREAVERGRSGRYNQFEVQRGLPVRRLLEHFVEDENGQWRVAERLRERIVFQEANLLDEPDGLGAFDLIFCRNVLVNFDDEARAAVLDRLAGALRAGGLLVLGGDEAEAVADDPFAPVPGLAAFRQPSGVRARAGDDPSAERSLRRATA